MTDAASIEIKTFAKAVADQIAPPVPIGKAVWSARQVAAYFDVTPKYVTSHLSTRPGFPPAKRLPSAGGQGRLRWNAGEVIAWWERQK